MCKRLLKKQPSKKLPTVIYIVKCIMIILTNALKCVCIITPTRYMYICEMYGIACRYITFNILYRKLFFSGNDFGLWCILFSVLIFLLGWILGETMIRVEKVLFSLVYRYHMFCLLIHTCTCIGCNYICFNMEDKI